MSEPQTTDPGADLHALIDHALTDLAVPTHRIQAGAVQRGRVVRRRRRLGATGSALAVAVVATAIAWPSVAGDRGTDGGVAHDTGPASTPATGERPPGWWNMPGAVMRDRLATLLPSGLSIADANLGNEDLGPGDRPTGGWISVDLTDSAGRPVGGVNVVLYPPSEDGASVRQQTTCPGNLTDPAMCTELHDAAGAVVGRISRSSAGDVVVLEATRLTPEGAVVYASSSNSSDDKWGLGSSVDRAAPSVPLADLRELAGDPAWRTWADGRSQG